MISDPLVLSIVIIFIMFVFLLSSIWIGVSLLLTGIVGMLIFDHNLPPVISVFDKMGDLLASSIYDSLNSWSLAALPMFILMGEILYKSSISTKLLNGLKLGCAGIRSATCNVTAELSRKVYNDFIQGKENSLNTKLCDVRNVFEKYNLISGLHSYYSKQDEIYKNLLPPLKILNEKEERDLFKSLEKLNFFTKLETAA